MKNPRVAFLFLGETLLIPHLYPSKDGAEPVATYIDARLPSGDDIDRASCIAALSRRAAAP